MLGSRVSSGWWQLLTIEWSSRDIYCDLLSVSSEWPTAHVFWSMFRLNFVVVFVCLREEARDWSWHCWWQVGCCGVLLLLARSTRAIFLFGMIRATISWSIFAFTVSSSLLSLNLWCSPVDGCTATAGESVANLCLIKVIGPLLPIASTMHVCCRSFLDS